eukprot:TRINITY_DN2839_c1_g1_i3.p1 TRINITY_DN2839_c1_g1~~TRINITY_DN2839_c1_g1_i3.p1  ORF type:complete len:320 (-),score=-5.42 TRINITY_DN2839_c1_g1_i3:182-1141(-)
MYALYIILRYIILYLVIEILFHEFYACALYNMIVQYSIGDFLRLFFLLLRRQLIFLAFYQFFQKFLNIVDVEKYCILSKSRYQHKWKILCVVQFLSQIISQQFYKFTKTNLCIFPLDIFKIEWKNANLQLLILCNLYLGQFFLEQSNFYFEEGNFKRKQYKLQQQLQKYCYYYKLQSYETLMANQDGTLYKLFFPKFNQRNNVVKFLRIVKFLSFLVCILIQKQITFCVNCQHAKNQMFQSKQKKLKTLDTKEKIQIRTDFPVQSELLNLISSAIVVKQDRQYDIYSGSIVFVIKYNCDQITGAGGLIDQLFFDFLHKN